MLLTMSMHMTKYRLAYRLYTIFCSRHSMKLHSLGARFSTSGVTSRIACRGCDVNASFDKDCSFLFPFFFRLDRQIISETTDVFIIFGLQSILNNKYKPKSTSGVASRIASRASILAIDLKIKRIHSKSGSIVAR